MAETKTVVAELDYLDEVAGQGFEDMDSSAVSIPMLLISQQLSQVVQDGVVEAGHFYNSLTGEDLGTKLELVCCQFQKAWVEWKPNNGGFVGRHLPGSIEVVGDNYTGMKTPDGNDVIETFIYLVAIPARPDLGLMMFSSTPGAIRYLKAWNTSMRYLRLPSGRPAPMFAGIWEMEINPDTNKKGNKYFSPNKGGKSSIRFVGFVDKEYMQQTVLPARDVNTERVAIEQQVNEVAIEDSTAY